MIVQSMHCLPVDHHRWILLGEERVLGKNCSRVLQPIVGGILIAALGLLPMAPTTAQDSRVSDPERVTADRFLQVLKRRPRPGTALDRVYGFHVQNGSLDEFIASLDVPDDAADAGQQQMILGLLQAQRGRQAVAAEAFAKAEVLLPDDYACSYFLGRSLMAVGQTEKAAAAIERAIDRQPARNEALPIFTELGRIYGRAGQSDKALEVWKKLEALFPGDSRVGGQIASTLAEEGNLQEALQRFEKLSKTARKDDDKITFAVRAAEMRRRLGQTDECTQALEKILARLRPGSWMYSDVRNRIEDGFLQSGDYDALANYYKKKLAESSDNLALQVRLGRILVSARRLDEAAETLTAASERAPDDPDVRLALVDVLVSKGEMAGAAKQFEKLSELDPTNPDYLLRWGRVLLEDEQRKLDDRRDAAAKVWTRLAQTRSKDAVTLSQIADQMRSIDRTDDAIALYEQAIDVDPDAPQYREYLGEYYHRLDRKEEAIQTWQSIAEGQRRSRDSLVRLAEVFGTFKQPERALAAWRDAAKLDLTFPQELRFAGKLRDAKEFEESLSRLDAAGRIAQTPDEREQLLKDRIATYEQAGTLSEQIARLQAADPTVDNLRTLAMMHSAAGQLADAAEAIRTAVSKQPDDANVLLVAAEISERQDRFVEAVQTFQKLAKVDVRFQTNYLQRVADLQMRLGQVQDALETCDSLIDANPASPESYQFLARLAFRAGQDDQAFTALRRAMNVAPRDNGPRRMLASAFADRYRTEEAIELYWQAMRYETKADGRIALARQLAPLYDRKAEIDELIRRIDGMGRDDVDARTTQLMKSAAHEAVKNYGEARQAIDRLLASQPRDVSLLETMVRLSDAADDVGMAAEFQERIVALADTPENRFKLVQFQLDAEIIDVKTALSERISLSSDPVRLGLMIRSAVRRGDRSTAIAICEEAIRRDPGMWDVKLNLAQLLLLQNEDKTNEDEKEEFPKLHRRAIELAREIRALKVPLKALPPTARRTTGRSTSGTARPTNYNTSPRRWSGSSYAIARAYRLGRYGSANYGYSSTQYDPPMPSSFGHARVLAACVEMTAIAKRYPDGEAAKKIEAFIERTVSLPAPEKIDDANLIWEYRALDSISRQMTQSGSTRSSSKDQQDDAEKINWRLAELDPTEGASYVSNMLMARITKAANQSADPKAGSANQTPPLTDRQVALVQDLYEKAKSKANQNASTTASTSWASLATYRVILSNHFQAAGDADRAKAFKLQPLPRDASLKETIGAISFYLRLRMDEQADLLVDRLLPAVRQDTGGKTATSSNVSGTAGSLISVGGNGAEFVERHRLTILDAVLAQAIKNSTKRQGRSTSLSDGMMNAYVRASTNSYSSVRVKAPLSTELLSPQVVTELSSLMPGTDYAGQPRALNIPDEVIEHLDRPVQGAPPYEQKMRAVLAAFAHWWTKRPEECYRRLTDLCKQFPDDVDLQIERARLAAELSQPRVALEALDSFDPLDSGMLVRKEMAAMNLASQLGDVDRAKQAAERLFGLRMDSKTQLALADQLRRLGMPEKSAAVLRRLRGGRSRDERTELQIAQAFLSSGDKEAAAEVAYTVLQRIGSGRGTSSNAPYYRQRAVSILKSVGRLDPLIEQAKRRLAAAPASTRARIELADLYSAAGNKQDADDLWSEIAKDQPGDPRQLVARASSLYKAKKYKEAATMFLDAFEKDPQLFNRHVHEMTRAVEQGNDSDEMFERLTEFNPESIPGYRIDTLIRVGRNRAYTEAKRNFIAHALKNSQVKRDFYRYINAIPTNERKKIPAVRETIISAICSNDAFSATSPTWRVSSRSSGGTANGPLNEIVSLLRTDQQARERFIKSANEAKQDDKLAPTADFILALLDASDEENRADAIKQIRKLVADINTEQNQVDDNQNPMPHKISGGLLWQAGQVLESFNGIDDKTSLLVAVYEAAGKDPSVSMTDMRYSVGARLVDALAKDGQNSRARTYLLTAFDQTDHSADDQYNPGYGDYQDIQSYQSIAAKLNQVGYPIDSLLIYRRLIASPERYAKAKRWSSGLTIDNDKKSAEQVAKKITPKTSMEYLEQRSKTLSVRPDGLAIKLLELPINAMLHSGAQPGLQMAIDSAASTQDGRIALKQLVDSLGVQSKKRPADWTLPATQIMIAATLGSDDLPELYQTLTKRLPTKEAMTAAIDTPDARSFAPLTGLYAVALAAAKSDGVDTKKIARELSAYLKVVSTVLSDPGLDLGLELGLASLGGDGSDSLQQLIDSIENTTDAKNRITRSETDACLNIAAIAAKQGKLSLSARALKVALQRGPPLKRFGDGSDPFAINQNQYPQPNQSGQTVSAVTSRLLALVDLYSDATGEKLGVREPKKSPDSDRTPVDPKAWASLDQAFRAIVLPASQPNLVVPYAKRMVSRTNYDNYSSNVPLVPESISIAMARVAAKAGTSDELFESLKSRMETAVDKKMIGGMMVEVALASKDPSALVDALDRFRESVDSDLPSAGTPEVKPVQLTSISSQVQQDSYRKSDIVDLMIRTLAPLILSNDMLKEDQDGTAAELLRRTERLINSDSYTASRHREIARRIRNKVMTAAATTGDHQTFETTLNQEFGAITRELFGSISNQNEEQKRAAQESLLRRLISEGMLSNSARVIRKMIAEESRANYDSKIATLVCLEANQIAKKERFEFLRRLALGNNDTDPVLHWGGFVRFSEPPEWVSRQVPRWQQVKELPTCSPNAPITDTILMLADLAVELGESEKLAESFSKRSKRPGDPSDIAAGIVRLAAVKDDTPDWTWITPTISAASAQIAASKPTKTDDSLVFPDLSFYLVTRLLDKGFPGPLVRDTLNDLRIHATRGKFNPMASVIARVTALSGIGVAADSRPGSPLEHFIVVSIPDRYNPDTVSLAPLYKPDPNGLVTATGGDGMSLLMLRYPVTGSFTVSIETGDGNFAEADLSYGGVNYPAVGWTQKAKLIALGGNRSNEFAVPSIKRSKSNREMLRVTDDQTVAVCNDQPYATDITVKSFPWAAISHIALRTIRVREFRIEGQVEIPREVDLIEPTMRGWFTQSYFGSARIRMPDPMLPVAPGQATTEIVQERQKNRFSAFKGSTPTSQWYVKDHELCYDVHASTSRPRFDPEMQYQYLRPLTEGDTVDLSFWWKEGVTEIHPSIGRTVLRLSQSGTMATWARVLNDVSSNGYIPAEQLVPPPTLMAKDNVPIDNAWNKVTMTRSDDQVIVTMNDKPLATIPIAESARPGFMRPGKRNALIRMIKLTGDWPSELPEDLTRLAD